MSGANAWCVASCLLLAAPLQATAAHAELRAHLDRDVVGLEEVVRLTVELSGADGKAVPDLTPLRRDFDVLETDHSSRLVVSDGQVESSEQWTLSLSPKRAGTLEVPPLHVGKESTGALQLVVREPGTQPDAAAPDVLVETEVTPNNPYVQGQVLYTVRLMHAVELGSGQLSDPAPENALVLPLGDELSYRTRRNGRRYSVTEHRYAIFPQASGTLVIPGPVFIGQAIEGETGSPLLEPRLVVPDALERALGETRTVRGRGRDLKVQVRRRPAAAGKGEWLPAESVLLSEYWSADPATVRVGEPVTRTVTVLARGLTGAQLPAPVQEGAEPAGGALKSYPEPSVSETQTRGIYVLGRRTQRIALVATRPGQLVLPAAARAVVGHACRAVARRQVAGAHDRRAPCASRSSRQYAPRRNRIWASTRNLIGASPRERTEHRHGARGRAAAAGNLERAGAVRDHRLVRMEVGWDPRAGTCCGTVVARSAAAQGNCAGVTAVATRAQGGEGTPASRAGGRVPVSRSRGGSCRAACLGRAPLAGRSSRDAGRARRTPGPGTGVQGVGRSRSPSVCTRHHALGRPPMLARPGAATGHHRQTSAQYASAVAKPLPRDLSSGCYTVLV